MKQEFSDIIIKVNEIAHEDVQKLHEAEKSYGNSWKQRGCLGSNSSGPTKEPVHSRRISRKR